MSYPDFNNITINNPVGVSPVGSDTLLIARHVAQLEFTRALEVGTGTGFIPIYLSTLGRQCDGIDINPQSITWASENAKLNSVDVKFYLSDLFANVRGKFDLIIFNPPWGNVRSTFFSKYLEIIKSLLPKENEFISRITYLFIKKSRRKLIDIFFDEVHSNLRNSGSIVILLHHTEFDLIKDTKFCVLDELGSQKLVFLKPFL
ncbi:MAG: methyltransferase [Okeania sp. SIO1H6]|nr:methyltransferase [Okeania sp. SIO1H6]